MYLIAYFVGATVTSYFYGRVDPDVADGHETVDAGWVAAFWPIFAWYVAYCAGRRSNL